MFSVEATTASTLSGMPRSAIAPMPSITAAPPDMSPFMSSMYSAVLQRDAAGVEGDRLADEPERRGRRARRAGRSGGRSVAGSLSASLGDRGEGAHAHRLDLPRGRRPRSRDRVGALGDLRGAVGEPFRRQVVGRAVGEIAGPVRPLRHALRALRQLAASSRRRRAGPAGRPVWPSAASVFQAPGS